MFDIMYRILFKLFPRLITSNMMIRHLKRNGVNVGKGTYIFDAGNVVIDSSRGCLLNIGEYVKITSGVIILTHDYSRSVLRRKYGEIIGEAKNTIIGDNVFIGMNSIVLMGTKIGNNCIIGAGSVVTGNIPDNSVVAGNPAKIIMSMDDYYKKRKNKTIEEALSYINLFYDRYKRIPTICEMGAFFPLYADRRIDYLKKNNLKTNLNGDNEEEIINYFLESKKEFDSYEELIEKSGVKKK